MVVPCLGIVINILNISRFVENAMTDAPKVAFILGISGQDGSYLTELLLSKDYHVYGLIRKTSQSEKPNLTHMLQRITLFYGDILDAGGLQNILATLQRKYPELPYLEVYNLAALSHVGVSFVTPTYCGEATALGATRILEAIRLSGYSERIRFYQASSSEMFGKVTEVPQTETTPFYPRSPYGVAKLYAHWITKNYREAYGLHASSGILFNHESPRRGDEFVTRKVTKALGHIVHGRQEKLVLGNLDAQRDWGHARDYVQAMWLMLQQPTPDDYVICTDETHSVRSFVERAFGLRGFEIAWRGTGLEEVGYDTKTGRELITLSAEFQRPAEVDLLIGDCSKAQRVLGWHKQTSYEELVKEMVDTDCRE